MMFKQLLLITTSCLFSASLFANASEGSAASLNLSGQGIGKIVSGSADILAANSQFTISAVKLVGTMAHITLKATGQSAAASIEVSTQVAGHASVAVGQSVQVSSTAAGQVLYAAGEIIAFIPNELGKSLIYNKTL